MDILEYISVRDQLKNEGYHIITDDHGWLLLAKFDREFVDLIHVNREIGTQQCLDNVRLSELAKILSIGLEVS